MKSNFTLYFPTIILLGTMFSFCSKPNEVHSKKEMERIMYDIYIAEAIIEDDYSSFNTPEKKEAIINEVFKRNKTNQARWDTSLSWYSDRVEIYLKMNDSVKARLQRQQKQIETLLNKEIALEESVRDRTRLTSEPPTHYSFTEVNPKNGFRFMLDSLQIKERIDSTNSYFSFYALGVPKNTKPILSSQVILEYKDTTIYINEIITENGKHSTPIDKYIDNDTLETIYGFVRLQDTARWFKNIQLFDIQIGKQDSLSQTNNKLNKPNFESLQLEEQR